MLRYTPVSSLFFHKYAWADDFLCLSLAPYDIDGVADAFCGEE